VFFIFLFSFSALGQSLDFIQVDPSRNSAEFSIYVKSALKVLSNNTHPIAQETLKSIHDGRVFIDDIRDITRSDYHRILESLGDGITAPSICRLGHSDYEDVRNARPWAVACITEAIDGVMWGRNVYLTPGQSPTDLALTLVHEVNHVLNRSHQNNKGDPYFEFKEEFRAHYVEALVKGEDTAARNFCRDLKRSVAEKYGYRFDKVRPLACTPKGHLIPNEKAWQTL